MGDIERIVDDLVPEETIPQGFAIDSLDKAEWALSKIARADGRIQDKQRVAKQLISAITARLEAITEHDRRSVEDLSAMLRPWAELEVAKQGKRKSVELLGGTVGFRQSPARLDVTDPVAAVSALEAAHPECVRIKKEVDKVATRKLVESTGEIFEGMAMVPGAVNFYVEAAAPQIAKEASNG
jgi:phage host-nuclease inhibitor protein Gam